MVFSIAVGKSLPNEDTNKVKGHEDDNEISPVPSHKQLHDSMSLLNLMSLFRLCLIMMIFFLLSFLLSFSGSFVSNVSNVDFFSLVGLRVRDSELEFKILFFLSLYDQLKSMN